MKKHTHRGSGKVTRVVVLGMAVHAALAAETPESLNSEPPAPETTQMKPEGAVLETMPQEGVAPDSLLSKATEKESAAVPTLDQAARYQACAQFAYRKLLGKGEAPEAGTCEGCTDMQEIMRQTVRVALADGNIDVAERVLRDTFQVQEKQSIMTHPAFEKYAEIKKAEDLVVALAATAVEDVRSLMQCAITVGDHATAFRLHDYLLKMQTATCASGADAAVSPQDLRQQVQASLPYAGCVLLGAGLYRAFQWFAS